MGRTKEAGQSSFDARSLDWRAADMLRTQILSGQFPPGYRLTETVLAGELDVSRGTLRAALKALTHEGLVAQIAYSKWHVPQLSVEDARELTTLHASFAGIVGRLAAEQLTDSATRRLEQARADLRQGKIDESDILAITADIAGLPRLAEQIHKIEQQLFRYTAALGLTHSSIPDLIERGESFIAAVAAADAAQAETRARDLFEASHQPLMDEILRRSPSGETDMQSPAGSDLAPAGPKGITSMPITNDKTGGKTP